jgi:DNA polymerase-3 subunit delta
MKRKPNEKQETTAMPIIDEKEMRRQLSRDDLKPVYFIYGSELYLKEHYVSQICKKFAQDGMAEFNLQRFDGKKCYPELLTEAAEQLPVMAGRKCVTVCDLDLDSLTEPELEAFKMVAEDVPESTVLVFYFFSAEPNPKRSAKVRGFIDAVLRRGCVLELNRRSAGELAKILADGAARRGCRLNPTTAKRIIMVCGNDLQTLQTELEKLCAFATGREITPEDVDSVCVPTLEASVFSLAGEILTLRTDGALGILNTLLTNRQEPVMIFGALSGAFVDIALAKTASRAGKTYHEAAADFGYKGTEFKMRNAFTAAKGLSEKAVSDCIATLGQTDLKLKSSRASGGLILQELIFRLLQIISRK